MALNQDIRRRSLLPLTALLLVAGYFLVFLPLDRRADELDASLNTAWNRLSGALGQTNVNRLDFAGLTNQFNSRSSALHTLQQVRQQALERIELSDAVRARIAEPFQLIDFEGASNGRKEALLKLAKDQGVKVEPAVLDGFPVSTADREEPALLWAELSFLDRLLTSAIRARVSAIHSVMVAPPVRTDASASRQLREFPISIELTGPAPTIGALLDSLPLRGSELKAAGLAESPGDAPPMFIDRLMLRKESPEKQDEVRLSLRAVGFLYRK